MDMKNNVDEGLKYIQKLELHAARDWKQLERKLIEILGEDIGKQANYYIAENWISYENPEDKVNFYDFKNQNLKTSLTISSLFDADIYRKACNWIYENKSYFGDSILDIGCDNGIMTCFLARLFPDAQIIAIDRSANAIKVASEFAKKMDVKNISFICSDIKNLKLNQKFETVFSMRTMNENDSKYTEYPYFQDIEVQGEYFAESLSLYSENISRFVSDNGKFICIARGEVDPKLLGWYLNFTNHGMNVIEDAYVELEANEVGEVSKLQANIFVRSQNKDTEYIYNYWCKQLFKDEDFTGSSYTGWQAEVMLSNTKSDLIYGCDIFNTTGNKVAIAGLWKCDGVDDMIIFYSANFEERTFRIYDMSMKEELKDHLQNYKDNLENEGYFTSPLKT